MTEISRPWAGIVTGDAGPYTDIQWQEVWQALIAPVIASQGVFKDQLNELDINALAGNQVTMDTGRAMVDGSWYQNNATVILSYSDAAANPRIHRVVLRKDFALQTIRLHVIEGAEAAPPVAPAIIQNPGVTWDLPLWQLYKAVGVGVVPYAYVDERSLIGQYEPAGYARSADVYLEDDFFEGAAWANGEERRCWSAVIAAGGAINYGGASGQIDLTNNGGVADEVSLNSGGFRPDSINAKTLIRASEPNNGANMDRLYGYVSATGSITPANGVFFRNQGAGNWFAVTRAGGVETATNTGVAPAAGLRNYEIRQRGTTAVEFYIAGALVAVNTTNIPAVLVDLHLLTLDDGGGSAAQIYMLLDLVTVRGNR